MRALLIGSLVGATAFAACSIASAADLPAKAVTAPVTAPYNWTGCYVGAFAGGAWAAQRATSTDIQGYNRRGDTWSYNLDPSVIAGGTLGCNRQFDRLVVGIEGEVGYINVNGAAVDPLSPFLPLDTEARVKIGNVYGLMALRAGYAWDRALVYAKFGGAFAKVERGVNDALLQPLGGNTIFTRKSSTEGAFAVGGGIEYALAPSWTIKGEYMYLNFAVSGTTCGNATLGGGLFCWASDFRGVHTAKLGFNYLFRP